MVVRSVGYHSAMRWRIPDMAGRWCALAAVCSCVLSGLACRKPADAGRHDLEEAGYSLTQDDWFRAVRENNLPVVKRFIEAGFEWNAANGAGDHALHEAARCGAEEVARLLLDRDVAVDLPGAMGRTPLMAAAMADQRKMVRWLIRQGAAPSLKDADGYHALLLAIREGKPGAAEELAAVQSESLDPALLLAALVGKQQVIDSLTNYGASVYARMEDGRTPLMVAAQNGHADAVKLLLELGANRHATDENGLTAVDHATANGYQEIVAILRDESSGKPMALAGLEAVGAEMAKVVQRADELQDPEMEPAPAVHPPLPRATASTLEGAVIGKAVAGKDPVATEPARKNQPPLVMRAYQERDLPLRVVTVEAGKAHLEIRDKSPARQAVVAPGEVIPGLPLVIVRAERRMRESKLNLGQPMEVSVVEVRDPARGTTREWIAGHPATAHDPAALVEDPVSGQRYVAVPGQKFRGADGTEFTVSDVRPNQLVIENRSTGEVFTLPLRGPRGG